MSGPYAAALFDMDGLLIDSERVFQRAWLAAAEAVGVPMTEQQFLQVVGRSAPDSTEIFVAHFGSEATYLRGRDHVLESVYAGAASPRFPLKAGVVELLGWLQAAGVPCAVASSSAAHEIDERLGDAGVRHYFAARAGGNEVARGKPAPDVYLLAAERLGVPAAHCIAFEDSESGAAAAHAAGAAVVVVPDLRAPSERTVQASLEVLGSLHDALSRVEPWFGPSVR